MLNGDHNIRGKLGQYCLVRVGQSPFSGVVIVSYRLVTSPIDQKATTLRSFVCKTNIDNSLESRTLNLVLYIDSYSREMRYDRNCCS